MRVVIADDNLLVREGLEQVLSGEANIEVVGSYADLPSLLEAIDADPPDVVLTDIRMPPSSSDEGIRVAARLRESHPAVGVVVLSQFAEPAYALALLESGSNGRAYLLKERVHSRAQLLSAIETVAEGGAVVDTTIVDVLVAAKNRAERSPLAELTPREREVLAQIAEGKSNGAIADSLVLTKRAVEKHVNSIFSKLDLSEAEDASKRVKAALAFLSADGETTTPDLHRPARSARPLEPSGCAAPPHVRCERHCRGRRRAVDLRPQSGRPAEGRPHAPADLGGSKMVHEHSELVELHPSFPSTCSRGRCASRSWGRRPYRERRWSTVCERPVRGASSRFSRRPATARRPCWRSGPSVMGDLSPGYRSTRPTTIRASSRRRSTLR